MSGDQLTDLAACPLFEIAAHGDRHTNDWLDIRRGRETLLDWLGLERTESIGFASPGSVMTPSFIRAHSREMQEMGFSYVRTGYRIKSMRCLRVLARKAARIIHSRYLYAIAYADTLQDTMEDMAVYAVPVLRDTRLTQLIYLIETAKKRKQCCTLLFHGILPDGKTCEDMTWAWNAESFEMLLRYLSGQRRNGQLELMTTAQAYEHLNAGERI